MVICAKLHHDRTSALLKITLTKKVNMSRMNRLTDRQKTIHPIKINEALLMLYFKSFFHTFSITFLVSNFLPLMYVNNNACFLGGI